MIDDDVLGKAYDGRLMRRLLTYLRPYRGQVLVAVVAIIGHSALDLVRSEEHTSELQSPC